MIDVRFVSEEGAGFFSQPKCSDAKPMLILDNSL